MIFRSVIAKDDERRCYAVVIDYFGIPLTVEIFPAWKDNKTALEVRILPPEAENASK